MSPLRPPHAPRSRAAFTLIELSIAVVLLVIMMMAVTMTTKSASSSYKQASLDENLASQAHRTMDFLGSELIDAQGGTLTPNPDGTSSLSFRRCAGWDGEAMALGPVNTFALQLEAGELDDGADNNGNGLVDERVLVWTRNVGQPNQTQTVKSHWIRELLEGETENGDDDNGNGLDDEPGLCFALVGDVLTIRLTLERLDGEGRLQTKTVESSMRVRN